MVPRPWDFASPPSKPAHLAAEPTIPSAETPRASETIETLSRPSGSRPPDSIPHSSDVTVGNGPHIPSPAPVLPEVVLGSPNGTAGLISV